MFGKKNRRKTKSPLKERPLRTAGESLQEEAERFLDEYMLPFWMFATFCLIVVVFEWVRWAFDGSFHPVLFTILGAVASAICLYKFFRGRQHLRDLRLGREGELTVAQMLDELRAYGFQVFNDIVGDGYNIDHVVVGPTGVYAIETKTRSIPTDRHAKVVYDGERIEVDGFAPERDPIAQALACADSVRDMLPHVMPRQVLVQPVVVFPGRWVEGEEFNRRAKVWVLNATRLLGWIRQQDPCLTSDQVAACAEALKPHARSQA
jgi:hypothetical protein